MAAVERYEKSTQGFSNHCKLLMVLLKDGVFNKCTVADQTRFELGAF